MFEKKTVEYYKNHKLRTRTQTDLGNAYVTKNINYGIGSELRKYQEIYVSLIEEKGRVPHLVARTSDQPSWGKINPRYVMFMDGSLSDKEGWDFMNDYIKKNKKGK
jgi:hypothetical protein